MATVKKIDRPVVRPEILGNMNNINKKVETVTEESEDPPIAKAVTKKINRSMRGIVQRKKAAINTLRNNTMDMLNTTYKDMGEEAAIRLYDHLCNGEKWAIELYYKSVFPTIFSKEWLSSVNISNVNIRIKTPQDITRICNELTCALLESGNGASSTADVKDAIKILSTIKTNEEIINNSIAGKLSDDQLKSIMEIITKDENAPQPLEFDF